MTRRLTTLLTLAVSGLVAVLARDPSCTLMAVTLAVMMTLRR